MNGVCSTTNAHLSSTLSSDEVHVLGSQGMVLPKTPTPDEVLADLFLSIDEGQDADCFTADDSDSECSGEDTETESTTAEPSITEDAALAAAFKTRKNVKKGSAIIFLTEVKCWTLAPRSGRLPGLLWLLLKSHSINTSVNLLLTYFQVSDHQFAWF